ncbi:MAG: hypothetical protein MUF05_00995 [Candidatus Omnitrophica bacterium]|jgi:type IV pilus assembly protein PilB|nr:hypothetical protein [Candidatus Omnitrophota bacterium]
MYKRKSQEHSQRIVAKTSLLGQLLVNKGVISSEKLDQALIAQRQKGGMLGEVLVEMGFISQEALSMALANQSEIIYMPIEKYKITKDLVKLIPKEIASKHFCVPLEKIGNVLVVAMGNPLDKEAVIEVEKSSRCKVVSMIATKEQILKVIKEYYK